MFIDKKYIYDITLWQAYQVRGVITVTGSNINHRIKTNGCDLIFALKTARTFFNIYSLITRPQIFRPSPFFFCHN